MKHMAIMGLMLAFALPAAPAEFDLEAVAQREIEHIQTWAEARDAELGLAPGTTAREWQERREREQQERREREQQERQAREDAERERQERTDALPPQARLAAELCHEADAVMAMVVDVARFDTSRHARESSIIKDRRYYPAAPAEVALKLSQLARDLRKEAALWGSPCDP